MIFDTSKCPLTLILIFLLKCSNKQLVIRYNQTSIKLQSTSFKNNPIQLLLDLLVSKEITVVKTQFQRI